MSQRRGLKSAAALASVAVAGGLAAIPFSSEADERPGSTNPLRTAAGLYHPHAWTIEAYADRMHGADAATLRHLARLQTTRWLTGSPDDLPKLTAMLRGGPAVSGAAATHRMPSVVLYNIPNRDCGSYSGGGAPGADAYRTWVESVSRTIGKSKVAVVLEPDALNVTGCLSGSQRTERWSLIAYAAQRLKRANPNAVTYIAAGRITSVGTMADRLRRSGVADTRGYALNVAAFERTASSVAYGRRLNAALRTDYHFVVDTSRNGSGPYAGTGEAAWCNPPGRTIGEQPTTETGNASVDAYLWVKDQTVDGACSNSNPVSDPARYTLDMAKASGY